MEDPTEFAIASEFDKDAFREGNADEVERFCYSSSGHF